MTTPTEGARDNARTAISMREEGDYDSAEDLLDVMVNALRALIEPPEPDKQVDMSLEPVKNGADSLQVLEPPADEAPEEYQYTDGHIRAVYASGALESKNEFFKDIRKAHFDEWLRRHDDKVRRQVSHPEPEEWEYSLGVAADGKRYRRRTNQGVVHRPGPWLPVPEEGS